MPILRYAVVFEKADHNWSAYVPDVLGCVACGDTLEETRQLMAEALALHLGAMREDGEPIPPPTTEVGYVEVPDLEPVPTEA